MGISPWITGSSGGGVVVGGSSMVGVGSATGVAFSSAFGSSGLAVRPHPLGNASAKVAPVVAPGHRPIAAHR